MPANSLLLLLMRVGVCFLPLEFVTALISRTQYNVNSAVMVRPVPGLVYKRPCCLGNQLLVCCCLGNQLAFEKRDYPKTAFLSAIQATGRGLEGKKSCGERG